MRWQGWEGNNPCAVGDAMNNRTRARIKACAGCDRFDHVTRMCAACGCFMFVKWRIGVAKCPLNNWKE